MLNFEITVLFERHYMKLRIFIACVIASTFILLNLNVRKNCCVVCTCCLHFHKNIQPLDHSLLQKAVLLRSICFGNNLQGLRRFYETLIKTV